MTIHNYSNGIRIVDKVFGQGGKEQVRLGKDAAGMYGPVPQTMPDWDLFMNTTIGALKQLEATPTGHRMIDEINGGGHFVEIGCPSVDRGDIPREQQMVNACYSPETAAQFYDPINQPPGLTAALRGAATRLNETTKSDPAREFLYAKLKKLVEEKCGNLTWENPAAPWAAGWKVKAVGINSTNEAFLKYALEPYLTRGGGDRATIRWHPRSTVFKEGMEAKVRAAKEKGQEMSKTFVDRPEFIALGHELIHAWRAVTGRSIFNSQDLLHDEHMTVGLTPRTVTPQKAYTGMHAIAASGLLSTLRQGAISNVITENQLRQDAKLALRPVY